MTPEEHEAVAEAQDEGGGIERLAQEESAELAHIFESMVDPDDEDPE